MLSVYITLFYTENRSNVTHRVLRLLVAADGATREARYKSEVCPEPHRGVFRVAAGF